MFTPNDLLLLHEYRAARQRIFQSESSATWFIRHHRDRLVRAGALVKIANRTFVHPERFDAVVLDVGTAQMERAG
jgi:hypothetical protein